jgi:hypothetical protein
MRRKKIKHMKNLPIKTPERDLEWKQKQKLLRKTEISFVGLSEALTRTEMKRSRCHLVSYPCRHTLETETEGTTYIMYDEEG